MDEYKRGEMELAAGNRARAVRQGTPRNHKTRGKLLEAATALMKKYEIADITSEMVLEYSGISRGSLYYHFVDFDELMGEAAIGLYAKWAGQETKKIANAVAAAKDVPSLVDSLVANIGLSQTDTQRARRLDHAVLVAQTKTNSHFAPLLADEQSRVTGRIAGVVARLQSKGIIHTQTDPAAIALLLQACTFGRVLDDVADVRVNSTSWDQLISQVLIKAFSAP